MRYSSILAAALALATPADARDLNVPSDKGWGHAASGLVLMPMIAGLPRTDLTDAGNAELDVMAHYENAAFDTFATIYLFRPALMSVPVWFDRSSTQVELRDSYGGVTVAVPPRAFARTGKSVADSLRAVWVPKKGAYKATGLAVMPLNDWLVVVRFDSKILPPAQLDEALDEVIAGIRFPETAKRGPAAVLVAPCPTRLAFEQAQLREPDFQSRVRSSLIAGIGNVTAENKTPPTLCRDGIPTQQYGVYHVAGVADGYMIALGDAGRTVTIAPGSPVQSDAVPFTVTLNMLDRSLVYPGFDRLPGPIQVLDDLEHHSPVASAAAKTTKRVEIQLQ